MRGAVVQSLKVRQMRLRCSGRPASTSDDHVWVGQRHAAQPHEVSHAPAHDGLGHVRQPFLEVREGRAEHQQFRAVCLELRGHRDLPSHADQRVFRRPVGI